MTQGDRTEGCHSVLFQSTHDQYRAYKWMPSLLSREVRLFIIDAGHNHWPITSATFRGFARQGFFHRDDVS